eukprot:3931767-Rhodomonas_salina.1
MRATPFSRTRVPLGLSYSLGYGRVGRSGALARTTTTSSVYPILPYSPVGIPTLLPFPFSPACQRPTNALFTHMPAEDWYWEVWGGRMPLIGSFAYAPMPVAPPSYPGGWPPQGNSNAEVGGVPSKVCSKI